MAAHRTVRGALLLPVIGLLLACAPADAPPEPKGDVVIGGHTYRLPDEAFADGLVEHGAQDSLLLELPVPLKAGAPPATVQLLLIAPSTSNEQDRERRVAAHIKLGAYISATHDVSGGRIAFSPAAKLSPDGPQELVQVATHAPATYSVSDVFVGPSLTLVQDFITCNRKDPAIKYPGCSQEFPAPGLAVRASYDREYLPYRKSLESYVLAYLQKHRAV